MSPPCKKIPIVQNMYCTKLEAREAYDPLSFLRKASIINSISSYTFSGDFSSSAKKCKQEKLYPKIA